MDFKGLILLVLTTMNLHSSVFSCPEECECYHDINLYTANCSSFPTSNENKLAKIEVLNLSPMSSVPLALTEGQFVGFRKLKYLSLSNCSIYYIHKKAFYGLKNLIEIDLSFNEIQTLDPLVFQHINDLTSLILRGNPIKFTANTPFLVSNTVQHLDLGLCNIKSIPRGVFFGVKKIMYISLDGNRLQTLKYNSLPRGLKYLNIANNMIVNVPIELLTSLTNLRRLDLSGNPINCTCPLMDLQDWFSGRGVTFDNEVICASPPQYAGRSWSKVNENELCITETLTDDVPKKVLKKSPKYGLKSREKYFSNDKGKYLETYALQADEPVHFINEKMDPNAEILFQNDDTLAMGEMMQDKQKEVEKTKEPNGKVENDTDVGDTIIPGDVEDASQKTAYDDIETDETILKENNGSGEDKTKPVHRDLATTSEANKQAERDDDINLSSDDELGTLTEANKEGENKQKLQLDDVLTTVSEAKKQADPDDESVLSSNDELDILVDANKQDKNEQKLQNNDVNITDTVESGGEDKSESVLIDSIKEGSQEETKLDNPPVAIHSVESKKELIPPEDENDEYDRAASEALLTEDLFSTKNENVDVLGTNTSENEPDENNKENSEQQENINTLETNSAENVPDDNKVEESVNKADEDTVNEEISNNPQNEIEQAKPQKESETENEPIPESVENENKQSSYETALDKDILAEEDLIGMSVVDNKENTSVVDATEEPRKSADENNIDTSVIVDNREISDEKIAQIKTAESTDESEHDKIEDTDLKPEPESHVAKKGHETENSELKLKKELDITDKVDNIQNSDLKPATETDVVAEDEIPDGSNVDHIEDDNASIVTASGENNIAEALDESALKTENLTDSRGSAGNENKAEVDDVRTTVNDSIGNPVAEDSDDLKEESMTEIIEQDNAISKKESEALVEFKEEEEGTTVEPQVNKIADINGLTVVTVQSESNNKNNSANTNDTAGLGNHLESLAGNNTDHLLVVNKTPEETVNEEVTTVKPVDSKEDFKSKLNDELFITDISSEINATYADDYDISTTETPVVLAPIEEAMNNKPSNETETYLHTVTSTTEAESLQKNDSRIISAVETTELTESTDTFEITTVSEPVIVVHNVSDSETEPSQVHVHDHSELESKSEENLEILETTTAALSDAVDVTTGESTHGNDTSILLVSTDNKHNADIKEGRISDDEVRQEPEPFELQESHVVLACILVLVLVLILFSVYKCAKSNKSTKRITKDLESNHGTEMQDMASLLPKPSEDNNKSSNKYPEDASSNEKIKLITEDKEEDESQYQRGNETRAVVEKENTLNNNAPNSSPNKPPPVNRTSTPTSINPVAPIQRTKVKVAVIPDSIPRTPIFVQKTYNGVSTNG